MRPGAYRLWLMSCLALCACGPVMNERAPDRASRVRAYLDALAGGAKAPGIQYLVVDSARTLFEYHGGWADIRRHVPMDSATTMIA